MILSFKHQFVPKILDGTKIHTIREDPHRRWRPGRKIHFATGVRTKNYHCFKNGTCIYVQPIQFDLDLIRVGHPNDDTLHPLSSETVDRLAKNDGFDSSIELFRWFAPHFKGFLIHWTDSFYGCTSKQNGK